jgi:hypothetical protein
LMRIPLKYSIRAVRVLVFTRPRPIAEVRVDSLTGNGCQVSHW